MEKYQRFLSIVKSDTERLGHADPRDIARRMNVNYFNIEDLIRYGKVMKDIEAEEPVRTEKGDRIIEIRAIGIGYKERKKKTKS